MKINKSGTGLGNASPRSPFRNFLSTPWRPGMYGVVYGVLRMRHFGFEMRRFQNIQSINNNANHRFNLFSIADRQHPGIASPHSLPETPSNAEGNYFHCNKISDRTFLLNKTHLPTNRLRVSANTQMSLRARHRHYTRIST